MGIAYQYGTTVAVLQAANHLPDPDTIVLGSVLQVPESGAGSGASSLDWLRWHGGRRSRADADLHRRRRRHDGRAARSGERHRSSERDRRRHAAAAPGHELHRPGVRRHPGGRRVLPAPLRAFGDRVAFGPVRVLGRYRGCVAGALGSNVLVDEPGWQTYISSVTGALGVCQLEPSTVTQLQVQLGQPSLDPNVASDNIEMAAVFLHQLLQATGGDPSMALAGYYQGLASVRSSGLFPSTRNST